MEFRGNLPILSETFCVSCVFNVRMGNILSQTFTQKEGTSQGCVLSVTL